MAEVIVGIIGGIGVGKSEFISSMKKRRFSSKLPSMLVTPGELKVYEESKEVKEIAAKIFYPALKRMDKYTCFAAEIAMLNFRIQQMLNASKENGIVIVERIPEENRYVFFENDYHSGIFGDPKSKIAKAFYSSYSATYQYLRNRVPPVNVFVYLDVKPEVALKRIKERGRKSERGISINYLRSLYSLYEKMVDEILPEIIPMYGQRLLRIDANRDLSDEDLKRFHLQIEERIIKSLQLQGWKIK
ncbi:MAG: deoxynucleoside kinase [Candidatus Micrarchaeota archaeon]|nr:deoxynucleoside kinase [Candidatus Micrarchaeota archaeon]